MSAGTSTTPATKTVGAPGAKVSFTRNADYLIAIVPSLLAWAALAAHHAVQVLAVEPLTPEDIAGARESAPLRTVIGQRACISNFGKLRTMEL